MISALRQFIGITSLAILLSVSLSDKNPDHLSYKRIFDKEQSLDIYNTLYNGVNFFFGFLSDDIGLMRVCIAFVGLDLGRRIYSASRFFGIHSEVGFKNLVLIYCILLLLVEFFSVRLRAGLSIYLFSIVFFSAGSSSRSMIPFFLTLSYVFMHPLTGLTLFYFHILEFGSRFKRIGYNLIRYSQWVLVPIFCVIFMYAIENTSTIRPGASSNLSLERQVVFFVLVPMFLIIMPAPRTMFGRSVKSTYLLLSLMVNVFILAGFLVDGGESLVRMIGLFSVLFVLLMARGDFVVSLFTLALPFFHALFFSRDIYNSFV